MEISFFFVLFVDDLGWKNLGFVSVELIQWKSNLLFDPLSVGVSLI